MFRSFFRQPPCRSSTRTTRLWRDSLMAANERSREKYPISQAITAEMQSRSQRNGASEVLRDAVWRTDSKLTLCLP